MDELTLLRSVRNSDTAVGPEVLEHGRQALLAHIDRSRTRGGGIRPFVERRRRARRARWVGSVSMGAAGVAAVLVLGNVAGFAGLRGGAEPAAAAVLDSAAASAITTSDPVVGAGQYLEVATHAVYATNFVGDHEDPATFLSSQNGQLYVPADTNDAWVWVRDPETLVQTFGPASEHAAAEADRTKGEYLRADRGAFYDSPPVVAPADLAALPRDPSALLRHIYTVTLGQGSSRDGEALVWIADTLRSGIVPADLRAALYKAAAGIPGVEVTDRQANLDGQSGVAIGYTEKNGDRQDLIVNPDSGLLIGEREVVTGDAADQWNVPTGTAIGWTAVTTSVVDAAPVRDPR